MVAVALCGRTGAAQAQGTVTEKLRALLDVLNTARGRDGLETGTGKTCSGCPYIPLLSAEKWPWRTATVPPTTFYDCLYLFFSCTDYHKPGNPFLLSFYPSHLSMDPLLIPDVPQAGQGTGIAA